MSKEVVKKEQQEVMHNGAEQLLDEGSAFSPNADVYLSEDNAKFIFDMPGVEKGDVSIQVDEENVLTVRGKNSHTPVAESAVEEFAYGNYYRAFKLGTEFDKNSITASLDLGVLTITVPKKEEAKPHRIEINA